MIKLDSLLDSQSHYFLLGLSGVLWLHTLPFLGQLVTLSFIYSFKGPLKNTRRRPDSALSAGACLRSFGKEQYGCLLWCHFQKVEMCHEDIPFTLSPLIYFNTLWWEILLHFPVQVGLTFLKSLGTDQKRHISAYTSLLPFEKEGRLYLLLASHVQQPSPQGWECVLE